MTLKTDHIEFLKKQAEKNGISVSAMNDIILEDYMSQETRRNIVNKGFKK
jgi:hypothetical protein